MFAAALPITAFHTPWDQRVEDRVHALMRRGAHRRIAYLYERPDTSTFRYRVYNMIQALDAEPDIAASWFSLSETDRLLPLLDACEAIVVCRVRYTDAVAQVLSRAKCLGVETIFDVDDLVFDIDYVHLLIDTLDQAVSEPAWDTWFAYVGRIGATMKQCDRAIVTNEYLAARAAEFLGGRDVRVISNFLNREQLAVSDPIANLKRTTGFARDRNFHLGFFSGTHTHNRDFLVAADAIARLLNEDNRLVLRVVGMLDLPPALADRADRIERMPLQNFVDLQRFIGETELNIVPLRNNVFTNCKSELKYFEAAAVATATLASPTFTFSTAIDNGINGWIARSYEWYEQIRVIIDDWPRYTEIAERAVAHVRTTYSPSAMTGPLRAALMPADRGARGDRDAVEADRSRRGQTQ